MDGEKDRLTTQLGLVGLLSVAYAIKLNFASVSGSIFYLFLVVQLAVALYLIYVIASRLMEAWTNYRWAPDRLR